MRDKVLCGGWAELMPAIGRNIFLGYRLFSGFFDFLCCSFTLTRGTRLNLGRCEDACRRGFKLF
jgi:hypothetical protein